MKGKIFMTKRTFRVTLIVLMIVLVFSCFGMSFTAYADTVLTNTSTVSSSITLGETINITGSATGGTSPYKFSYYFKQAAQSGWTKKNVANTVSSTTVKPSSAVPYNIKVVVIDAEGAKSENYYNVNVMATLTNTSTASTSIRLGETINITGSASGGTAPYKYEYYFKQASYSAWSKKNVANTVTSTTVKPGAAVPYNVKVVVTDSKGVMIEKFFNVSVTSNLTNTSTASSSITLGNTINITGSASGGTSPYKYEYYFKQASQSAWSKKNVANTVTSTTVKPGAAVPYNVKVVVTDAAGAKSEKTFDVTVNPAAAPLVNTSTASSSINLGETINITGAATGGVTPYKYEYYFKQASKTDWSKKNVANTVTSTTVKPGTAVPYNIKVVVTDAAGATATKTFDVDVVDNTTPHTLDTTAIVASGTCGENVEFEVHLSGTIYIFGTGDIDSYIYMNDDVKNIITKCVIEDGVKSIGAYIFDSFENLTSVSIPDSVTSIGNWAFVNCDNLPTITIPNSVVSIGEDAFSGCFSLSSVSLPSNLTTIKSSTFKDCSSLSQVVIPSGVIRIADGAFENCTGLTRIVIPNSVVAIGEYAFNGCLNLRSIEIPDSVTKISAETFYGCQNLTSVTIPKGVTNIDNRAFAECTSLKNVVIRNTVTRIGYGAFSRCSSLNNIVIPDSVTSILDGAFEGCSALKSIVIPGNVTNVGSSAFCDCQALQKVIISDGVTGICSNAFDNSCGLTKVEIPSSVTSIGDSAFMWCPLKDVYFTGTIQQWNDISKYDSSISDDAIIHFESHMPD